VTKDGGLKREYKEFGFENASRRPIVPAINLVLSIEIVFAVVLLWRQEEQEVEEGEEQEEQETEVPVRL